MWLSKKVGFWLKRFKRNKEIFTTIKRSEKLYLKWEKQKHINNNRNFNKSLRSRERKWQEISTDTDNLNNTINKAHLKYIKLWKLIIENMDPHTHQQMHINESQKSQKRGPFIFWHGMCVLRHVRLFVTPQTSAHQAPLSLEFSRQEMLEWVAISFWPRDPSLLSLLHWQILYHLCHLETFLATEKISQ